MGFIKLLFLMLFFFFVLVFSVPVIQHLVTEEMQDEVFAGLMIMCVVPLVCLFTSFFDK